MHKSFVMAEVKSAPSDNPNGEFEIIMSTDSVDRDGESVVKGAFEPLPDSIPVHAFHDFTDPVGRAVPSYDDQGRLVGKGFFAATPRAQEIRQLVSDGVIGHTSVGFMAADRKTAKGETPTVEKGELLEVSFVSVPSNRDAAVLAVKAYQAKAGARNSTKDGDRLQSIHDLAVENGAQCAAPEKTLRAHRLTVKVAGLTYTELRTALDSAVTEAHGAADTYVWVRDFSDDWVVFEVSTNDSYDLFRQSYTITDGVAALTGSTTEVVASISYLPVAGGPEPTTDAPEAPSDEDGKSPASKHVAEKARLMAAFYASSLA